MNPLRKPVDALYGLALGAETAGLEILAEISVRLAGLASIVGVLGQGARDKSWTNAVRIRGTIHCAAVIAVRNTLLWWNAILPVGAMIGHDVVALLLLLSVAALMFVGATFRTLRGPNDQLPIANFECPSRHQSD